MASTKAGLNSRAERLARGKEKSSCEPCFKDLSDARAGLERSREISRLRGRRAMLTCDLKARPSILNPRFADYTISTLRCHQSRPISLGPLASGAQHCYSHAEAPYENEGSASHHSVGFSRRGAEPVRAES